MDETTEHLQVGIEYGAPVDSPLFYNWSMIHISWEILYLVMKLLGLLIVMWRLTT